jgi:tetratricopeptide (TPR) repeat protein
MRKGTVMSEIKKSFARVVGTNNTLSFAVFLLISISSPPLSVAQLDSGDWNSHNVWARFELATKGQSSTDGKPTISVNQLGAPNKARKAIQKALEAWHMNKLADADRYADEALAAYPRYAAALTIRGIIALESGPQQACEDLQKAIEYDPNYGPAHLALGSAYNRLGRYDDAARTLDRALAIAPTSWQGYYELSVTSLGKGDFKAALRLVEKASSLVPMEFPQLHMVRALAFIGLQNKPAATTELTIFLMEAPNDPSASIARQKLERLAAPSAGQ